MKKVISIILFTMFILPLTRAQENDKSSKATEKVVFTVNMDCNSCVEKITKQLTFEKGVKDLYVNLENQIVAVKYRPDKTSKDLLKKAIEKLEYVVKEKENKEGLPDEWK